MRKFILHTLNKTKSFSLNTTSTLVTEPTGLGNNFSTNYKDSEKGKHLINVKPEFDPIKFKIYFNADGTSGYVNYKSLLSFLSECGTSKFILEYDDGITDKFCEVVIKSLPKSEISSDNEFAEEFTFERQTYWYEEFEESFSLQKTQNEQSFPLHFPFGFAGVVFTREYNVKNSFFVNAPIKITISGQLTDNIQVYIKSLTGEIVSQVQLSRGNVDDVIIIDPTSKKITITDTNGNVTNGYGLTDKTKQSFLYLPQGEYIIGSNMKNTDTGAIEINIKKYLFD